MAALASGSKDQGLKDRLITVEGGTRDSNESRTPTAMRASEYQSLPPTAATSQLPPWIDLGTLDAAIALGIFGQAGVLTRWGWNFLTIYQEQCHGSICRAVGDWVPNTWVAPFACLPANMAGCFIMGMLSDGKTISSELKRTLDPSDDAGRAEVDRVAALPLAAAPGLSSASGCAAVLLGLRTGYCGCLTSFSEWNTELIVDRLTYAQWGSMIVGYVFGLILCVSSYRAGQQLALGIAMAQGCRLESPQRVAAWCDRNAVVVRSIGLAVLVLEFSLLMVQVFTCGHPTYSSRVPGSCADDTPSPAPLFDLFFAPFGVWGRWRLGLYNGRFKTFPIGTFAANMIACAIDCFIAGAEYRYTFDPWSLMILTAVSFGFCGALSTVSTFIAEVVDKLPPISTPARGNAFFSSGIFYGLASVICCFAIGCACYLPWTAAGPPSPPKVTNGSVIDVIRIV